MATQNDLRTAGLDTGAKSNNEAGVRSKFVGKNSTNLGYLQDPRVGYQGSRALGWTSNTGNYFGADGSQGTVLNVNTTAGHQYKLTLCKSRCSYARRVYVLIEMVASLVCWIANSGIVNVSDDIS